MAGPICNMIPALGHVREPIMTYHPFSPISHPHFSGYSTGTRTISWLQPWMIWVNRSHKSISNQTFPIKAVLWNATHYIHRIIRPQPDVRCVPILAWQGHQRPWNWLCGTQGSLFSTRKFRNKLPTFNYLLCKMRVCVISWPIPLLIVVE